MFTKEQKTPVLPYQVIEYIIYKGVVLAPKEQKNTCSSLPRDRVHNLQKSCNCSMHISPYITL